MFVVCMELSGSNSNKHIRLKLLSVKVGWSYFDGCYVDMILDDISVSLCCVLCRELAGSCSSQLYEKYQCHMIGLSW